MARVTLQSLTKRFGDVLAVHDVSLEIREGEFFSILGPSGCGKTTTLRLIAGFERPDRGKIYFDETEVTQLPPQKRNIGMVFQNYALFPHMTVEENVAFGLDARKVERSQAKERVREALAMVGLAGLEERPAPQLSGGQQQRVALARAIVIQPRILLLDEPLSNLDAKLRVETREQLRSLQRELGITTFYVTHDQEEALTQSDRLAIFFDGECAQIGTPQEVYTQPASERVMAFLGQANFLDGRLVARRDHHARVKLADGWEVEIAAPVEPCGEAIRVGFRPHEVLLADESEAGAPQAQVLDVVYNGASEEVRLRISDVTIHAVRHARPGKPLLRRGQTVPCSVLPGAVRLFDPDSGKHIEQMQVAPATPAASGPAKE